MTTFNQLGPIGSGKATTAIGANKAVKWDTTPGNIVVCGVGDKPIGYTQDPIAAGVVGDFVRASAGFEVFVDGAGISAGDYLKCGASGALVQEATPSVLTAATVGQAKTASDSNNQITVTSV